MTESEMLQKITDQEKTIQTQRDTIEALSGQLIEAQQIVSTQTETLISTENVLIEFVSLHSRGEFEKLRRRMNQFIKQCREQAEGER